jgi:hypothetical protein
MYGTTKILSLIMHLVGLIGHRPIESFGPLQLGHYPNLTTMKFLTTNFRAFCRPFARGPATRRFPPPWTIDEANDACFIVRDATRQALGYFYFEEEPGRRSVAKLLTKDEARRMAGDQRPGNGTGDGRFEILRQSTAAAEPCESSFDHPSARQNFEPLRGGGSV